MIKNSKSLIDKSKVLANKYNITINEILQNYMFERILERISLSKYKRNFILKGGLLLSSLFGIDNRTTMDMDTSVKGITLGDVEFYKILSEILNLDIDDGVKFEIKDYESIMEEDEYSGIRYNIIATFESLRMNLCIDVATGDLITPREIEYEYKMMFENKTLNIMTYNIETIVAEKFQTIIERGILNSRMKDYYDLYIFMINKNFTQKDLKNAINKTFEKRGTDLNKINNVLIEIENSEFIKQVWDKYTIKHKYTRDIHFYDVISKIKEVMNYL